MPSVHGLGLDDDQSFAPFGPAAVEKHLENEVRNSDPGPRSLELEYSDLLEKGHVLEGEIRSWPEQGADELDERRYKIHNPGRMLNRGPNDKLSLTHLAHP